MAAIYGYTLENSDEIDDLESESSHDTESMYAYDSASDRGSMGPFADALPTSRWLPPSLTAGVQDDRYQAPLQPFRFMDLSAELRNHVYSFALTGNGIALLDGKLKDHSHALNLIARRIPAPGILRTCKQIHQEARDLLYELNEFSLWLDNDKLELSTPSYWLVWDKIRYLRVRSVGTLREKFGLAIMKKILAAGAILTSVDIRLYEYSGSAIDALESYQDIRVQGQTTLKMELWKDEDRVIIESEVEQILTKMGGMLQIEGHEHKYIIDSK
jgi:hypothetical protein